MALRDAAQDVGVEVRAGIHCGEITVRAPTDVAGLAVHIAARVSGHAGAGEIVVSRTVCDLVVGSGFVFDDHGTHHLKGVDGMWNLFAVATHR